MKLIRTTESGRVRYYQLDFKIKNMPDVPRYKALGNSMAVPVMRWIGERIRKYETANYNTKAQARP
jgi:site-specific DNA-cytosine methylase